MITFGIKSVVSHSIYSHCNRLNMFFLKSFKMGFFALMIY